MIFILQSHVELQTFQTLKRDCTDYLCKCGLQNSSCLEALWAVNQICRARHARKKSMVYQWKSNYAAPQFCPTLTEGSKWQFTQIWESEILRLDLAYSTSIPSLEQKHSSCWKIFKSRHNDIALMSMYITDTFCSFTRNVIFKSCFLLSEYGRIVFERSSHSHTRWAQSHLHINLS